MSTITTIIKKTRENTNYRMVIHTSPMSQLVVMNIPVGGEIGQEKHEHVEQSIFIVQGKAMVTLEGKDSPLGAGEVVVVSPGTVHNLLNMGTEPLLVYTVYVPPHHLEGRIHATKADAKKDVEDENFGKKVSKK